MEQLATTHSPYHLAFLAWLEGELEHDTLRRALNELVARHAALRTFFPLVDGRPVQVVRPELELELPLEPVEEGPEAAVEQTVSERFDLAAGPLVRARLFQAEDDRFALALVMHHAVSDGRSLAIVDRDLFELYAAAATGRASGLPPLPVQYADFAVWQRRWMAEESFRAELDFWRQALAGVEPLELPLDRLRPPTPTFDGSGVDFVVPSEVWSTLAAVGQAERATPFMTALALFQALLARWTGQHDIVVGTPVGGRPSQQFEDVVGCFVNTLMLRGDLRDGPTFREFVGHVRESAVDAYTHQDVPFQLIVAELEDERDLARNPLFQVSYSFDYAPFELDRLVEGIRVAPLVLGKETARFDLELHAQQDAQGLSGTFVFKPDLFEKDTIIRLARQFELLAQGVAADPDRPVDRVPLLPRHERERLVEEWRVTDSVSD
jgi:fengycin family lipopeptide synthetase B